MSIQEGTHEYTLEREIEYSLNGGPVKTKTIVLQEPGMEHIKFYLRLKQMITRSQMELAKQATQMQDAVGEVVKPITETAEQIESEIDGAHEMISLSLHASETVDIGDFIGTFEKMACTLARRRTCMIDGKMAITKATWNNLHPNDAFEMAVRWCAFFTMPSAEGQKTISGQQSELPTEPMAV